MFVINLCDMEMFSPVLDLYGNENVGEAIDDYTACLLNNGNGSHITTEMEDKLMRSFGELGLMIIDAGYRMARTSLTLMTETLENPPFDESGLKNHYHATVERMVIEIF